MAEERSDLRKKLDSYKFEFGLMQKIPCSQEENEEYLKILKSGGTLPEGVYAYYNDLEFYTVSQPDLTEAEVAEYLTYKKLKLLKTIKNGVMFFVVLTIIGLVGGFLMAMQM